MRKRTHIFILLFWIMAFSLYGCGKDDISEPSKPSEPDTPINREHAFEINDKLGRGINLGNMYEDNYATDEAGNPWNPLKDEYFGIIANLGFKHIRMPIRWETRSSETAPYKINDRFLSHIKSKVDKALAKNMSVIINMHHHEKLLTDPYGQKSRFLAQWGQIAEYFKNYSDKLVFEILNEPTGGITPAIWNNLLADGLKKIRESNPNRVVLIGTALGGHIDALKELKLPDDPNIILTVHYYLPFEFTHQGADWTGMDMAQWLGTKWYDTEIERKIVQQDFQVVDTYAKEQNIPVHVGEFGAIDKADLDSRVRWTNYLTRWFEKKSYSWAYWEFSAGFGIYDRDKQALIQPLANALVKNSMPIPGNASLNTIYGSNFANNINGWTLSKDKGVGTIQQTDGALVVDIQNAGSNSWDLQIIKSGVSLQKGKHYLITMEVSSTTDRTSSVYIGLNAPNWDVYSGIRNFRNTTEKQKIYHLFMVKDAALNNGRLVIDLGGSATGKFNLYSCTLEEVTFQK
ncbi:cellulase family glycosylhydrolase [Dysgonomonas sp. UBA7698]|uniref:cellulase family glycosylhydrolase n=1 Tax=Dysgonomonas sp. UBA7698 TaxID=1946427 RepID=UPI0025C59B3F|nr:cellulase family glycosylhydrolase [Dysgonomonas sp. UBA7698]